MRTTGLCLLSTSRALFLGDDNPQQEIGQQPGQAAWYQQEQKQQPEPEGADAGKLGQPTTDAADHAVLASK